MRWLKSYWAALHRPTETPIMALTLGLLAFILGLLIGLDL